VKIEKLAYASLGFRVGMGYNTPCKHKEGEKPSYDETLQNHCAEHFHARGRRFNADSRNGNGHVHL
jgi:hypothetical protein